MIYLYHGSDTFTLGREIKKLKTNFGGLVEELTIGNSSDSETKNRVLEVLQSQGLFAQKKLVILKNFLREIKAYPKTEEYFASLLTISQAPEIIFEQIEKFDKRLKFFKTLQKSAEVRQFDIPAGEELEEWIENYFLQAGFKMDKDAAQEFVRFMSPENGEEILYDLWQVSTELDKLMLFRHEAKMITLADVRELVSQNISQNVFLLTNLFAEGRSAEAQKLLDDLITGVQSTELKTQTIQIIGALASQIRSLLLVKDMENETPAITASTLGWKEGRVWIVSKLARKFTKEKLVSMMRDLRALDMRLKTSEEPPKLLLSLFLQKTRG